MGGGGGHRQREQSCSAAVMCGMIRGRPGMLRPAGLWHISAPPQPRKENADSQSDSPPTPHSGWDVPRG